MIVLGASAGAGALDLLTEASGPIDAWAMLRIPLLTAAVWIGMLSLFGTRAMAILGGGATEYKRVAHATGLAFGIVAMLFVVFQWHGVRMQLKYDKQEGGKGLFLAAAKMEGNRNGESLAGGAKKPECVVTGGAASIAVSYMGKQYFVCCSGCRDAFNENPAKFVAEAAKKK